MYKTQIIVDDDLYWWLIEELEKPPKDIPGLKELMERPSPFENK